MISKFLPIIRKVESRAVNSINRSFGKYSVYYGIFGVHIERLGLLRSTLGGCSQYLSIPYFVGIHLYLKMFDQMIKKIDDVEDMDWEKYLVIDRYKIEELCLFDRFNCAFCGWANGLFKLHVDTFQNLMKSEEFKIISDRPGQKIMLSLHSIIQIIGVLYIMSFWEYLIKKPLKYENISFKEALESVPDKSLKNLNPAAKRFIKLNKAIGIWFTDILSELESSWCPIKHLSEGIFPDHHRSFIEWDQIPTMLQILKANGSLKNDGEGIISYFQKNKDSSDSIC